MKEHQRKLRGLLRIVFGRSAYVVLFLLIPLYLRRVYPAGRDYVYIYYQ